MGYSPFPSYVLGVQAMKAFLLRLPLFLLTCVLVDPVVAARTFEFETTGVTQADEVDDYIKAEMEKRQIPGLALAVVKNGEVIKAKGYGLANLELDVPVTPDSVFELASVTKSFTATAIMILVEEGKVALDDKISKYFINAPYTWRGITVRHLLTHTAGFASDCKEIRQQGWLANYTTAEMFEAGSKCPADFAPGDRWQYSDMGYFLLGMIIEKVSGTRWREFVRERIFQPLGMTATTVIDQWAIIKNHVAGYALRDGKLAHIRRISQIELPSHYGILSTVKDLAKWDAALYTEKLLQKARLDQMWTPVKLNNGFGHNYGFGWSLSDIRGHRVIGHGGITGTYIFRLPDDKLTVIVLANLSMASGSSPLTIARGVAGRYVPGLLLSSLKEQMDPDPQMTQKMRKLLSDIANGVTDSPLMTPERNATLNPVFMRYIATPSSLKDLKSFTFVACDDVRERRIDRFGVRVSRICYYRLVTALETRYLSFYLTADDKVADIRSSTE